MRRRFLLAILACLPLAACGGTTHHATTTSTHRAGPAACPGYVTAYGCAAHSPTFGLPPNGPPKLTAPSRVPTREQFDSVNLSVIPTHPAAVAGYLSGHWPTYMLLAHAFPSAIRVPVAIRALPVYPSVAGRMVCLDIEPGDAAASEAGAWDRGELRIGVKPCDYANLSTMPAVRASIAAAGVARSRVLLWDADWTFSPHLDAGYDATQWTDHALGRNLDESAATLGFLGVKPAPKPAPDLGGAQHYERYPQAPARPHRERATIQGWDQHACMNPVRRPVCKATRAHLAYDLGRDQALARHDSKALRDQLRLPGRIQGLSHRLNNGRGVVRRWL